MGDRLVSCFQFQENLISLEMEKFLESLRAGFYCKELVKSLQANSRGSLITDGGFRQDPLYSNSNDRISAS